MKDSMRRLVYSAVIMVVSFASVANAQVQPQVIKGPVSPVAPVAMPETASTAILATDLLSVGVLIFMFRRRATRTNR
jgi:hypothetical protein